MSVSQSLNQRFVRSDDGGVGLAGQGSCTHDPTVARPDVADEIRERTALADEVVHHEVDPARDDIAGEQRLVRETVVAACPGARPC